MDARPIVIDFVPEDQDEIKESTVFEPAVYPVCVRCNQAWMLRRARGAWAWSPDCTHRTAACKLVQT